MPPSNIARSPEAEPQLSPLNVASLLARARILQRAALDGTTRQLLRGKNLGLLYEAPHGEAQALFRRAAEELGAHVAAMRSSLSPASAPQEVQHTARMLGRLYEAVECQGLEPALVQCIGQHAGIPVFDGAAMRAHPADRLAELLGDTTSLSDNRRFVLQAMLLEAIG
ncbi:MULTISPECIES: ornithine carbamoyltransferase [Variovorax]|jgi:ornithine carbamoyltransferase|uniref:ornithine carbamoyltransferase n=1 Tax=Variovorax TaxID=34072 RepID=UPI0008690751|nr:MULTISPECIES: ornithine carbamoyltransferase [Variovorax]MBN8758182.1 ornithine carbamoyltransferase [Variovorax sp.]ODU12829.1 MAG: ornithine carbamoyltransferase [Variovorax sp. SCN 67-85]ODV19614.1 MAG: ornithine carbamoyltransferase [Variovorax sp. SCN 67-20]OJZ06849.1 MAG: ornithine carbamoyltransferase [Variovorax sp. 67-131]UKI07747.1 ornithine carbamoyltransferase [Variovorax paradoxus]